jgi:predicted HicB family RNase H-like nuclease
MGKTSTASKNKWNAQNYDQLRVVVKKGKKDEYKAHAQSKGMSLNAYIISLIEADIKKEQGE